MAKQLSSNKKFFVLELEDADGTVIKSVQAKCHFSDPDLSVEGDKEPKPISVSGTYDGTMTLDAFLADCENKLKQAAGIS